VLKPRVTLREAKVVEEAVEAVVAAEVEQVAETRGNVLLGMVTQKAPTLASLI
jgi:phosphoribosyl-ATP pyrophosphohydrolase